MPTDADVPSPGSASALRRLLFPLHCNNVVGRPLLHGCHQYYATDVLAYISPF